ncbi:hypothetical protein PAPYR_6984 [Paratrimastix pyriformis]|uniref:F-box domain-containing protein n=1 Tax=Paratrimastix pyriformis TaxID=342808 RepID=A0ABQ8UGK1_9EUKA|nr:hypothetical protein PAPYR_6984 [Paratrimastix pyriformis]
MIGDIVDPFQRLPDEIICVIFQKLSPTSIVSFECVSRRLRMTVRRLDDPIWKDHFYRSFRSKNPNRLPSCFPTWKTLYFFSLSRARVDKRQRVVQKQREQTVRDVSRAILPAAAIIAGASTSLFFYNLACGLAEVMWDVLETFLPVLQRLRATLTAHGRPTAASPFGTFLDRAVTSILRSVWRALPVGLRFPLRVGWVLCSTPFRWLALLVLRLPFRITGAIKIPATRGAAFLRQWVCRYVHG